MPIAFKACAVYCHPERPNEIVYASFWFPNVSYRLGRKSRPFPGWGPLAVCLTREHAEDIARTNPTAAGAILRCHYEPAPSPVLYKPSATGERVRMHCFPNEDAAAVVIPEEVAATYYKEEIVTYRWRTSDGEYHGSLEDALKHMARRGLIEPPTYAGMDFYGPKDLRKVGGCDFPVPYYSNNLDVPGIPWHEYLTVAQKEKEQ